MKLLLSGFALLMLFSPCLAQSASEEMTQLGNL
jgi:hypothetical protein